MGNAKLLILPSHLNVIKVWMEKEIHRDQSTDRPSREERLQLQGASEGGGKRPDSLQIAFQGHILA